MSSRIEFKLQGDQVDMAAIAGELIGLNSAELNLSTGSLEVCVPEDQVTVFMENARTRFGVRGVLLDQ